MVEFVIVLPILVMLVLAIWQFGVVFFNYIAITDAARVGARAAVVNRATPTGPCSAAKTAIQNTVSATQWGVISTRITCTPREHRAMSGRRTKFRSTIPSTINILIARPPGTMTASATERLE